MEADRAAPYLRLMKMVERELAILSEGRLDDFRRAVAETGEYMRTLPTPAPAAALPLIHRAIGMRAHIQFEAQQAQARVGRSLASLRQKRQIRRKYRTPQRGRYSTSA
jgi:hypothetical protein